MSLTMILMPVTGITFLALLIINVLIRRRLPSPYQGSRMFFSAIVINWLFYLFGVFLLLPVAVADVLFTFIWVVLLFGAAFWAIKEFRNNRWFALLLGALTLYSSFFVILLHGISQM